MSYLAHWWQIWWLILFVVAHQRYCTVAWLFLRCGYSSKTGIFKKVSIIWKISRNLMAAVLHSVKKVKFITKQNHYVKMKLKIYKDLRMVITKVMEMNNTTFPDNELFCLQYPPAWHTHTVKAFHGLYGLLGASQRFQIFVMLKTSEKVLRGPI